MVLLRKSGIKIIKPYKTPNLPILIGGFNPSEKYYSSQIGSFPQMGVNKKKYLKPPPRQDLRQRDSISFIHFWVLRGGS